MERKEIGRPDQSPPAYPPILQSVDLDNLQYGKKMMKMGKIQLFWSPKQKETREKGCHLKFGHLFIKPSAHLA